MARTRKSPSKPRAGGRGSKGRPLHKLEALLGHRFADAALLQLALTHRSHTYEARNGAPTELLPAHPHQRDQRNLPGTDNEQLEFLGDAILGLAVTEALVREFPQCSEGELTRLRSNLVSRARLAELGVQLGLGEALLMGRSAEYNGGREKPALLANAVEAVLAAVYIDLRDHTGPDLREEAAVERLTPLSVIAAIASRYLVEPELEAMRAAVASDVNRGALRDHKTLLQERVQSRSQAEAGRLRYVDTDQSGPPHLRRFTVEVQLETPEGSRTLASAEGGSKKEAQQRAAELALAAWPATSAPGPEPGSLQDSE